MQAQSLPRFSMARQTAAFLLHSIRPVTIRDEHRDQEDHPMNSALRTTLLLAIASTCIDAEAKPLERCILSLEARPANIETSGETTRVDAYLDRFGKPRCPLAVVYPGREASRTDARSPRSPRFLSPVASDDEAVLDDPLDALGDTARGPITPGRPVLHV